MFDIKMLGFIINSRSQSGVESRKTEKKNLNPCLKKPNPIKLNLMFVFKTKNLVHFYLFTKIKIERA